MGNCIAKDSNGKVGSEKAKFVLFSDFTCPYCYLEFLRLTKAMSLKPEEERLVISFSPFQLDDSLPAEGVDKYKFLSNLIPPAALDPMIDELGSKFKPLGVEFTGHGLIGNSAQAHCVMIWASETASEAQQLKLMDALFQIHCSIGKSIGDPDAIVEAAAKAGFDDEAKIRSILKNPTYTAKLKALRTNAATELGITTVPCLTVVKKDGKQDKLEEAAQIETVQGFTDLIEEYAC
mmetsp:Transcript_18448/g.45738  ORF Transcript_18448/g.45738 Transcript_18448/m.45738 type:complete len:235 (-) Transcript_18448:147-851(-)